jgi:predicted NBD/HSP70 family sugar kinase
LGCERAVGYDEALDLAASGDVRAAAVVGDAGRALGRLVAAVANTVMTDRVVLAGEGARLAVVARGPMEEEIGVGRHPKAAPVAVEVRPTDNRQWACGAAVSAIADWLAQPDIS